MASATLAGALLSCATFASATLLISGVALANESSNAAGKGVPSERIVEALAVDPADWKPEHAPQGVLVHPVGPSPMAEASPDPQPVSKPQAQAKSPPADAPPAESQAIRPQPAKPQPTKQASRADDSLDPEDSVTAPAVMPSHDPLDRPNAAAPKSGETAKPDADKDAKQAEPLPPLNAAIKAALDKREGMKAAGTEKKKEREAIAFFYAAHGFAPVWSDKGKANAAVEPILARLAQAGDDALDMPSPPKALTSDGKPEDVADSDIALTEAVVSYARQATGSRIDPHAISPLIGARPELADPAEVLDSLVAAGVNAGDTLQALNPTEPRYVALRKLLTELRMGRSPALATPIAPGPTLKIGMRDERVPALRSRFALGAPADAEYDDKYDKALAAAVAKFQGTNGIAPTGHLTKATVAALAGDKPSRNEGSIIANMEMWRWMPRDLGADRIEVNVPDYMVTVFHDGEPVAQHRVVVGKTDTPTPLFSNTMKFLIVNPVWNVPQSIIKNEMDSAPRAGFTARYVHGRLFLQQPSGPKNALGRIKFMFPNPFSVYLHDTPAKALFSSAKRAFSHGCVRVDKPFDFAESVLNDGVPEGGKILWSQPRLQKMLGTTERYVYLPKPLPIHIEYFTARVDNSGHLAMRDDIYGYAGAVAAALGHGGSMPPKVALPEIAEHKPAFIERQRRRVAERAARRSRDVYEEEAAVPEPAPAAPPRTGGGSIFGFFPF